MLTSSWVVTNSPSGHSFDSSTRTLPPASTIKDRYGSGTQAPSISPCWNACSVTLLSCGMIVTSPSPLSSACRPSPSRKYRAAMSWVLPGPGVAMLLPFSCSTEVMSGLVTSAAPPEAAPATMRTAPSDWL